MNSNLLVGGAIALAACGLGFFIWRLVHSAKELQKEADDQRVKAENAKSLLNSVVEGRAQEDVVGQKAQEAKDEAKANPLGDWK